MFHEDHKLAAIVFTDIEGYTLLMEEDEQKTMLLLQRQREIVFPLVREFGGEILKEIGDGLLMMFGSALQAVKFAMAMQHCLREEELSVRAGIHIGEIVMRDGDVFGAAVNIASRIQAMAPARGICISDDVRVQLLNKTDIRTQSLGRKELKNVKSPVEIHLVCLAETSPRKKQSLASVVNSLWNGWVIQTTFIYLFIVLVAAQVVRSIVNTHMYSPHWISLTWIVLLSLVPTVVVLAMMLKNKRIAGVKRLSRIMPSANVLVTIALAILLFGGKDLGSITTSVTVENEEGQKITRTLMKSEFRKNIALFGFENKSADTGLNWVRYGLPLLMQYDFTQDKFIRPVSVFEFIGKAREMGSKNGLDLSFVLMKRLAEMANLDYFITGSFSKNNNLYHTSAQVYETRTGRHLTTIDLESADLFSLSDLNTVAIKQAIGIPETHIQQTTDLPVSEMFTSSFPAFRYLLLGLISRYVDSDWNKAAILTKQALDNDPGFTLANLYLVDAYLNTNQTEKMLEPLDAVMQNIYKLPEKQQFKAKITYYIIHQQPAKAMAVNQMWVDLFPEDLDAHRIMAQRYIYGGKYEQAIQSYQNILKMDPSQDQYLASIGKLFQGSGKWDSAMVYFKRFEAANPQDALACKWLGDLYLQTTDFARAKEYFERASLLDPGKVIHSLSLLSVELRLDYPQGLSGRLESLLQSCNTGADSSQVYDFMVEYYNRIGKIGKSNESYESALKALRNKLSPKDIMTRQVFLAPGYAIAGNPEKGLGMLKDLEARFHYPLDKITAFGYMLYYIEMKDPVQARRYIAPAMELIEGFGEQLMLADIWYGEGRIAELEGDYTQAIISYQKYLEKMPGNDLSYRLLAGAYRKAGNLSAAVDNIAKALRFEPYSALNLLEAAKIAIDRRNKTQALEYLRAANQIWAEADPLYEPAREARELLRKMEEA